MSVPAELFLYCSYGLPYSENQITPVNKFVSYQEVSLEQARYLNFETIFLSCSVLGGILYTSLSGK